MAGTQPPTRPIRTRPPVAGMSATATATPGPAPAAPVAPAAATNGQPSPATWEDFVTWQAYAAEVLVAVLQGNPAPDPPA